MEIVNGYGGTIGLTPSNILSSDIATGDVSETNSSKIFFFTGDMDLNSLYNISSESQLLTSYSSTYLGTITTDLTYKYLKNAKKNIIKMSTPNARRFKDPRYVNNTYALGTTFTKPAIGTKYKFKFTSSTVKDGFLLNGVNVNTTYNEKIGGSSNTSLITDKDGFDELFLYGTQVSGGEINFTTNQIFGYRVSGVGPKGYTSISLGELRLRGYSVIECNVSLNSCGLTFVGSSWDNRLTSSYGWTPTKITINFNNMTITNSFPYEGANTALIDISSLDLSNIYIGMCGIQAYDGWVDWNVLLYKNLTSYMIESDFFTTTENITITNPTALTHSGFEVIPYGDDDKPLSNQINWCAIKVGNNTLGDKLIFTDDIGTFINPSFVNLSKRECVYGIDNILHSLKIEVSEKGN